MRREERTPWIRISASTSAADAQSANPWIRRSLAKVAAREGKAALCKVHPVLCSGEGVELIRNDLAGGAVNAIIIAACSPRMKTDAFAFDPLTILERVNLREHVAWCHAPKDEDTQMAAEDYLRMGIAKAQRIEKYEPVSDPISKKLLVVGGGLTGITAALEASRSRLSCCPRREAGSTRRLCGKAQRADSRPMRPTQNRAAMELPTRYMRSSTTRRSRFSHQRALSKSMGSPACLMSKWNRMDRILLFRSER